MISLVTCKKGLRVQLPDGVSAKNGDVFKCPKNCVYKKYACKNITEFTVCLEQSFRTQSDADVLKHSVYTDEEIIEMTGGRPVGEAHTVPTPSVQAEQLCATTAEVAEEVGEKDTATPRPDSTPQDRSPVATANKYQIARGSERAAAPSPRVKESEALCPIRQYDRIVIKNKVYSNNVEVRKSLSAKPLREALTEIFYCWETKYVFRNERELRDDFVWLVTETSDRRIEKSEVQEILENSRYSRSQKFFYLFYDVIYKHNPPTRFYWCDDAFSFYSVKPEFEDRQNFIARYCGEGAEGEVFRKKYQIRKREMLHYLNVENEEKFFDEMTFEFASRQGEIVCIDKERNYTPVRLGKIDDFIENMKEPSSPDKMADMISFLKKYRVSDMGVVLRNPNYPLVKSERGDLKESDDIYSVLPLKSSSHYSTEYDNYVTLLREYVREFNPSEIKIGQLIFTKANYSTEIKRIVGEYCSARLGATSDLVVKERGSRASLVKSLYERDILCNFVCENSRYIDRLMKLVDMPTPSEYYELFDNPTFLIGNKEKTVREYIEEIMREDVYTVCGEFRKDERINEYFKYKKANVTPNEMNSVYQKYREQYEDFISR